MRFFSNINQLIDTKTVIYDEKLNRSPSPDGRENPPDFSSGDWNDSGNELDEKAKTSAPK